MAFWMSAGFGQRFTLCNTQLQRKPARFPFVETHLAGPCLRVYVPPVGAVADERQPGVAPQRLHDALARTARYLPTAMQVVHLDLLPKDHCSCWRVSDDACVCENDML